VRVAPSAPAPADKDRAARPLRIFPELPDREVPPARGLRPEPDVQITIGRIEVRAVPEPVRQPARGQRAQLMTLDEYLRMRSGEVR
jgi:hypothetical protein